jgi:hypothetical protein
MKTLLLTTLWVLSFAFWSFVAMVTCAVVAFFSATITLGPIMLGVRIIGHGHILLGAALIVAGTIMAIFLSKWARNFVKEDGREEPQTRLGKLVTFFADKGVIF